MTRTTNTTINQIHHFDFLPPSFWGCDRGSLVGVVSGFLVDEDESSFGVTSSYPSSVSLVVEMVVVEMVVAVGHWPSPGLQSVGPSHVLPSIADSCVTL